MKKKLLAFILSCVFIISVIDMNGGTRYVHAEEKETREEFEENGMTESDNSEPLEIIGFGNFDLEINSIHVNKNNKPTEEKLISMMPKSLEVIIGKEKLKKTVSVRWKCTEDYEGTDKYYYQFSPVFSENIVISKEIDLYKDGPYIAVFMDKYTDNNASVKSVTGTTNETIIYNFLRDNMGCNIATSCGILANIYHESGFNPTASCIDTNGLTSYGICQWNGARYTALQNWCNDNGYSYSSISGQLYYLKFELTGGGGEANAWSHMQGIANTAEGAYTAGYNWAQYFERCAQYYNGVNQYTTRGNLARDKYWPEYGNDVPSIPTGIQTISDGVYHIVSAIDDEKTLTVADKSKVSGANIQLWSSLDEHDQTFYIRYLNDGYYQITSTNSGLSLDVADGGTALGTNLQQCTVFNNDAQKWVIKDSGDGRTFNIISKCNGLYIDVANGISSNGTNIWMYQGNQSIAQKWRFVACGENVGQTISNGDYHIVSALNDERTVSVAGMSKTTGANIQLWNSINETEQVFSIKYLGNGYYQITSRNSGLNLDVTDGKAITGTNVQQCTAFNNDPQKWIIKESGDGKYYYIISKSNGLFLDVADGIDANGTNIWVCRGNYSGAQKWRFVAAGDRTGQTISNGDYQIVSYANNEKAISVANASMKSGGNIILSKRECKEHQIFNLTYLGNGYYKIKNRNSNMVFDSLNGETIPKTNLQQCIDYGTMPQQWIIKKSNINGAYNIICRQGGLSICASKLTEDANVQMVINTDSNTQKWLFVKVQEENKPDTITSSKDVISDGNEKLNVSDYSVSNKQSPCTIIKSVKNKKGKKVLVNWKVTKNVTGYQVQYSRNSKFKGAKTRTIKGSKKSCCVLTKLKKGKKYYIRIRTYIKKSYSSWSKARVVQIKK